jgi:hypothetical protein
MFSKVNFLNEFVFISHNSFKQNKSIAKKLRLYVNFLLIKTNLTTIGGEAYLIGIINKNVEKIINYTNSKSIFNDVNFNNKFHRKIKQNLLIDYNTINYLECNLQLLINLPNLNVNLMNIINKTKVDEIIIINCHHLNFWKRIKLLTNYKLISRKYFIDEIKGYFITVNILRRIIYIPLGENCSVAYNLNELNLRNESYPFDWCKMSIKHLNNVLKSDFQDFTNVKIKKFSENHNLINETHLINENHLINEGSYLLSNKYNIIFAHEINNYNFNQFQEKLKIRIIRFKELKNKLVFPIFIIATTVQLESNELKKLNVNLKKIIGFFKLKFIKLNWKFGGDWKYSHLDWKNLIY